MRISGNVNDNETVRIGLKNSYPDSHTCLQHLFCGAPLSQSQGSSMFRTKSMSGWLSIAWYILVCNWLKRQNTTLSSANNITLWSVAWV